MENKVYSKPVVEAVPVQMSSIIMAGSGAPGIGLGGTIDEGEGG